MMSRLSENNHIVRMWKECGLPVENAGDSQALIQLKKEYCDKKECLRRIVFNISCWSAKILKNN